MSTNPRDTQFAGFAKAQWEKVANNVNRPRDFLVTAELLRQEEERIIARRAYDLVDHVVCWIDPLDFWNPWEHGGVTQQTGSELTLADIDAFIAALPDEPRANEQWERWDAMNRRIAAVVNRSYQRRRARNAQQRRTRRLVRRQRRAQQRKHQQGKQR